MIRVIRLAMGRKGVSCFQLGHLNHSFHSPSIDENSR